MLFPLWYRLLCLRLVVLLITSFPAVRDLRQELADAFNIFFRPGMQAGAANLEDRWCGNFALLDIAAKSLGIQPQFPCSFTRRDHFSPSVADNDGAVKYGVWGLL